jgi:hypothetical protein
MIDYYVIVIGGGRPTSTVPALSRKADCALPNTAITGATCDIESGQKLLAGG